MKKFLLAFLSIIMAGSFAITPVFADTNDHCVKTSILSNNGDGEYCDESGNGQGIIDLLWTITNFMTVGIGVLGVVGITIVGVQYLTAGGNEEKTRKAKRRMFEIVIGLVAYVLIYALLRWLMPHETPTP